MLTNEIVILKDLALELGESEPALAYRLIAIPARLRPGGSLIRAALLSLWKSACLDALAEGRIFALLGTAVSLLRLPLWWLRSRLRDQPLMSAAEADFLRQTATSLVDANPLAAFRLFRLLDGCRLAGDSGTDFLRERLGAFSGHMLTARSDGTTERLNAVLIGYLFAQSRGLQFRFSWAQGTRASRNELLCLRDALPDFFRADFVRQCFIPFQQMRRLRMPGIAVPPDEFASGYRLEEPEPAAELQRLQATYLNFLPPVRLRGACFGKLRADLRAAVETVLSEPYLRRLEELRVVGEQYIGLHYRGGDVIYGMHRHTRHAVREKSAPLSVVEAVIGRYAKEKILLFGTPLGETRRELDYLRDKYSNVQLAVDHADRALDPVVQDSILMSCCRNLIAYRNTGVAHLALLLNPDLDEQPFDHLYTQREYFDLCYQYRNESAYTPLQRSYQHIRALALAGPLGLPLDLQRELLAGIRRLDPENSLEWLAEAGLDHLR